MKSIYLSFIICFFYFQAFTQNQRTNYNDWNSFYKEFKTAIIKDNESKILSLSNKVLAEMPAKEWIKSAKGGSEFSTVQKLINTVSVEAENPKKKTIDFADTNNCYFEFRLTANGWRLYNVIYYAD